MLTGIGVRARLRVQYKGTNDLEEYTLTKNVIRIYRTEDEKLNERLVNRLSAQTRGFTRLGDDFVFCSNFVGQSVSRTQTILKWDKSKGTYLLKGKPLKDGDMFECGKYRFFYVQ